MNERRMKYLNGSENAEQDDKKNQNVKKNVQLAPLDHSAHTRNSSMPPGGYDQIVTSHPISAVQH